MQCRYTKSKLYFSFIQLLLSYAFLETEKSYGIKMLGLEAKEACVVRIYNGYKGYYTKPSPILRDYGLVCSLPIY